MKPPYNNFPCISSDRILLRQVLPSDIQAIVDISFYDGIKATKMEEAIEMQAKINKNYLEGNSIHWAIIDKATSNITGTCGYYRGFENDAGELGCVLLRQYQGKGLMTEALKLAIDFGLHVIKLKRIWAVTTKQNHKAIKLLNKLNFIKVDDLPDNTMEYELNF